MSTASIKNLGLIIQKHRKAKNYTTVELAEILNVSTGFINNLEHGKNDIFKLDLLLKLINELNINPADLTANFGFNVGTLNLDANKQKLDFVFECNGTNDFTYIKDGLQEIITSYLNLISEYSFDPKATKIISEHIINEIKYTSTIRTIV